MKNETYRLIMKFRVKTTVYCGFLYCSFLMINPTVSYAQSVLRNFGNKISVQQGTSIFVKGDVVNMENVTPGQIDLQGTLDISGNLTNTSDSLFLKGQASTVRFTGDTPSQLISTAPVNIRNLIVNKENQQLTINNANVFINKELVLTQGSIDLNNSTIEFKEGANLIGENNSDEFVYGTGSLTLKNQNTGTGFNSLAQLGFFANPELPSVKANVFRYNAVTEAGEESIDLLYKVTLDKRSNTTVGLRYRDALKSAIHTEPDLSIYVSRDSVIWRKLETKSFNITTKEITAEVEQLDQAWFTVAPTICANLSSIAIDIVQEKPLCDGSTISLTAFPNVSDEFIWDGTTVSNSIDIIEGKDYQLTRITGQGCEASKIENIPLVPQPTAQFETPSYKCKDDVFTIANTSTNTAGDNSNLYSWELDGQSWSATGLNPTFPSGEEGLRIIKLVAFNAEGCADTISQTLPIYDLPEINTDVKTDYCENEEIVIADASTSNTVIAVSPDPISKVEWTIDGVTTEQSQIDLTNKNAGAYDLALTVSTARDCKSTEMISFVVNEAPEASFTANDTCVGSLITVKNVLPTSGTKSWYINDQLVGASDNLITPGTSAFNVNLIVENSFNCVDTATTELTSFPTPVADFMIADTCSGLPVRVANNTTLENETLTYEWLKDNEVFSTEFLPELLVDTVGDVNFSLVASTSKGCSSTDTKNFSSFEVPIVSFKASDVCEGQGTKLENTSAGESNSYELKLDTETSLQEFIDNYVFTQSGEKNTTLVATSVEGCTDSLTVAHEVFSNPDFEIADAVTCIDSILIMSPLVSNDLTYLWSSGFTGTSLTVKSNGNYDLSITDSNGCNTIDDFFVEVDKKTNSIEIVPDTTVCDSLSINAERLNSTYLWSTGETTPSIKIDKDRVVNIKIVDEFACEFYDTITVKVDSTPSLNLTESFIACENDTVFVTPETDFGVPLWSNGSTVLDQELIESEELKLILSSPAGNCRTEDSTQVTFFAYPEVNLGSDTTVCDEYVLFNDVVADTTFWQVGTQDSLVFNKSETEILTAINGGICVSRDTVVVEVFDTPALPASNLFTACEGNEINIQLNEAEQYLWSNGDTTSLQKFVNNDTTRITLTNGICVAQDTLFISFFEVPQFSFGEDSVRCASDRIAYNFNESGFNNQWFSEATGLISTTEEVELTESGTYWLESRDNGICSVTDTINLTVVEDVEADFLSSSIAEIEDSLFFVAVNDKPADSYFWDFGNGFTSTEKNIINQYFIPDTYDVSLIVTLGNCADTLTQEITIYNEGESPVDLFIEEVAEVVLEDSDAFPNPFDNQLNVLVELSDEGEVSLHLYDLLGESMFQKTYRATSFREDIDTADLIPGKYTLYIITGKQRVSYNLVKE